MRQTTLAEGAFAKYKTPTRKEKFLSQMDEIIPWRELSEVIEPHYPQPQCSGRRPIGIERMLRIHFMQHWFNLSDPGMEEAPYDIAVLREFADIDLGRDPDMHQTRKGNQWYFGMKTHIGVDSQSKLIHSVAVTPANTHDSQVLEDLLHGEETKVWGDSAYSGQEEVLGEHAPKAKEYTQKKGSRNRKLTDEERSENRKRSFDIFSLSLNPNTRTR